MAKKGIIYQSLHILLPISQIAHRISMSSWLQKIILASIKYYQRSLSPYKGFSCAYRQLYGEHSCSQFFYQAIKNKGLKKSIPLFQKRLEACSQASKTLNMIKVMNNSDNRNQKRKMKCGDVVDCSCDLLDFIDCCDSDCNLVPDCLEFGSYSGCDWH